MMLHDDSRVMPSTREPRKTLACVATAFTIGCGADTSSDTGLESLDAVPEFTLEEIVRIGSTDDPNYGFSRIGPVRVGPDGNLYVFELQDLEIRVYGPGGELLRRFGGPGEGPGEFGWTIGAVGLHADTIWVYDFSYRRLTFFSLSGDLLSTARLADVYTSDMSMLWPVDVDDEGYLVSDLGLLSDNLLSGSTDIPIVRFRSDGSVVDTAGSFPWLPRPPAEVISVGRSRYPLPAPPSTAPRIIRTGRGLIVVETDDTPGAPSLQITRLAHGGDTLSARRLTWQPVPFDDRTLDSIAADWGHQTWFPPTMTSAELGVLEQHPEDTAAARTAIRRQMRFPEVQPPVRDHRISDDGGLWLQREDVGGEARRWTLLDPDDRPIGAFMLPPDVAIARARGDSFWARVNDEFGVPWLVHYRLVGHPGGR